MTTKKSIWILEDQPNEAALYQVILGDQYELSFFDSLESFQNKLKSLAVIEQPALIIADLKLKDGENFLRFLQSENDRSLLATPFIVTSGTDDINVMQYCFGIGASDYLVKPFNKNEFLMKVNRALQQHPSLAHYSEFGDDLQYTLKERLILEEFLKNSGRRVSRQKVVERVWPGLVMQSKTLDVHLCNLRRKLHLLGYDVELVGNGEWLLVKTEQKQYAATENVKKIPTSELRNLEAQAI